MSKLLFAVVALLLAGCAANQVVEFDAGVAAVEARAAADADKVLAASRFVMCRGITVGAWVRAFGSDPDKAKAWKALCAEPITQTP